MSFCFYMKKEKVLKIIIMYIFNVFLYWFGFKIACDESIIEFVLFHVKKLVSQKLEPNYQDPLYVAIYINWMYLITMYGVPFVLLLSLNWKIGREIHLARIRRKKMTRWKENVTSIHFILRLNCYTGQKYQFHFIFEYNFFNHHGIPKWALNNTTYLFYLFLPSFNKLPRLKEIYGYWKETLLKLLMWLRPKPY